MNNTPIRALVIALGILLLVAGGALAGLQIDDRSNRDGPGVNTESSASEVPEASDDSGDDASESPDEDSGTEAEAEAETEDANGDDANESPDADD